MGAKKQSLALNTCINVKLTSMKTTITALLATTFKHTIEKNQ
jgi:hypothetical protein